MVESKGKQIQRYAGANIERVENASLEERQNFEELCLACRQGDVNVVENLVSGGKVNINAVDQYDYSPLFLASLCGKEEVVRYLLHQGAMCDRDTFQGERCIYGALNDTIRNLLLQFDISKSVDTLQPFAAWISSFLTKPLVECSDYEVELEGVLFALHRFIFQTRCPKFLRVNLDQIDPKTLIFVIRYLYLYEQHFPSNQQESKDLEHAARLLGLNKLVQDLKESREQESIVEKSRTQQRQRKAETVLAQDQFSELLNNTILANQSSDVNRLNKLAAPDVILQIDLDNDEVVYFVAHKAILVRSEYFEAMFCASFAEAQPHDGLPIVGLPVESLQVAKLVLTYLYTDKVEIPLALAMQVMYDADMLLLDRLKQMAAITITKESEPPLHIVTILKAAWELRVERLEQYVAKHIAADLERYIHDESFKQVVTESANRIQSRQETDTIELVDDIRYYLAVRNGIFFGDDLPAEQTKEKIHKIEDDVYGISQYEREYNAQLDKIDDLLEELSLQA